MRKMQILVCMLCFSLQFSIIASDFSLKQSIGEKVYLKYNIYNSPPEMTTVYKDKVVYTNQCIKTQIAFSFNYPFPEEIMHRGDFVEIVKVTDESKFVVVFLRQDSKSARVRLVRNWRGSPSAAYNFIFEKETNFVHTSEVEFSDERFKTRSDLIRYFGFPLSVCKEGNIEIYYYSILFMGFNIGADEIWIELQGQKIVGFRSTL